MMIDFLQYGALGIVGFVVYVGQTKTNKCIENNTIAMTKFYEMAKQCKVIRGEK